MSCLVPHRGAAPLLAALLAALALPARADDWSLDALRGSVEVARGGVPVWAPARSGQTLRAGDAVRTRGAAQAQLAAAGVEMRLAGDAQVVLEGAAGALETARLVEGRCRVSAARAPDRAAFRLRGAGVELTLRDGVAELAIEEPGSALRVERGSVHAAGTAAGAPRGIELLAGFAARWPGSAPFEVGLALPDGPAVPAAADDADPGAALARPRLRATLIPGQSGAGEIALEGEAGQLQTLSPRQVLGVIRGEPGILRADLIALLEASGIPPDRLARQLAAMF